MAVNGKVQIDLKIFPFLKLQKNKCAVHPEKEGVHTISLGKTCFYGNILYIFTDYLI